MSAPGSRPPPRPGSPTRGAPPKPGAPPPGPASRPGAPPPGPGSVPGSRPPPPGSLARPGAPPPGGPPRGPPGPPGAPPPGTRPLAPTPGPVQPQPQPMAGPMVPAQPMPMAPVMGPPPPPIFTDQETLNRQFDLFEQSHQSIRDFFLREDQLLGEERSKFEEWKQAQQQWLDHQNQELASRQQETKQHEEYLQHTEKEIQRREREVQKQQQQFQQMQRSLQLAQAQHAQAMAQHQQLAKQQQESLIAAQQAQLAQQQQLAQQEQQQALLEHQLEQQRIQQAAKRDQLAQQAALNQQQAQSLQQHAQQQSTALLSRQKTFQPSLLAPNSSGLMGSTFPSVTNQSGLMQIGAPPLATPPPNPVVPLPGSMAVAPVAPLAHHANLFNPGPIHTYVQDREEPKSGFVRQALTGKWTDPDFRPDNSSLFCSSEPPQSEWGQAHNCQWMRTSDMWPGCSLFKGDDGGPSGADIHQGVLGDMWFLNALSCVAINPNVIRNLVVAQYPDVGLYEFRFWKGNRWITVMVDDYLPVRTTAGYGRGSALALWASHSTDYTELWVPLLEKAYAKLHGSYQALTGGNTEYAMVDLTGGVAEHIAMNTENGKALARVQNGVADKLRQAKAEGWLVGCVFKGAYNASYQTSYAPQANGLIPGRSYALLDIRETGQPGQMLVRLRNPWGAGGWSGNWGASSSLWTKGLQDYFGYHPDMGANQPTFWMDVRDFEENIAALQICRTCNHNAGDPYYLSADLDGYWGGMNAGGQVSMSNPQYIVGSAEDASGFVFLSQYDVPYQRQDRCNDTNPAYRKPNFPDPNPNLCCGVFILQCDTHSRMNNPTGNVLTKDIIKYATFVYGRQVGAEFRFEAGKSICIMPCQFQGGIEAPYQITIVSSRPFAMRKTLGEGIEQQMPVFSISFSTPPAGFRWDPAFRHKIILDRQPKGEVLEEDDEKR